MRLQISRTTTTTVKCKLQKKSETMSVKARLPAGFPDYNFELTADAEAISEKISALYRLHGFQQLDTPVIEYAECLGKFTPDVDLPNNGVFYMVDSDGKQLALRYDLTAPLSRYVAEHMNELTLPLRAFRKGPVFRNEKQGRGRFRQFTQIDADVVGANSVVADAEMCMLMADALEAVEVKRGDYIVNLNNRKIIDGVLDVIEVIDPSQRLAVFRTIDKLERLGIRALSELLGAGRTDASGDYTKGAGLSLSQVLKVTRFLRLAADEDYATINKEYGSSPSVVTGFEELRTMTEVFKACGYKDDRIKLDLSCVRGLEYYTGPVYEAQLMFDVTAEAGESVRFLTVGGGGRYDGLVKRFTGQSVPATGFSIGVSRLSDALNRRKYLKKDKPTAPVLITVMGKDAESMNRYQQFARKLREEGIMAEVYQGNPKDFSKQVRYADKRGCPIAIIQGSNEYENTDEDGNHAPLIIVKDLELGKSLSFGIDTNASWRLLKAGQETVYQDRLVLSVKEMLYAQSKEPKNG
jgi:histidyl-tRNA synthetase